MVRRLSAIVRTRLPIALLSLLLASAALFARPTSAPYTGDLAIFEDAKRDANLQVERVLDLLNIHAGSCVADIGAGSGWFTVRAARRVGTAGRVDAVEINAGYLARIRERATAEKLTNIRTILGRETDPLLAPVSVDAVLLLKTYHEIAQPREFMRHVHDAVKPRGLVGIIDRNGKGDDHGLDAAVVIVEMRRAGFTLKSQHDFVKADGDDYFLIFARAPIPPSS